MVFLRVVFMDIKIYDFIRQDFFFFIYVYGNDIYIYFVIYIIRYICCIYYIVDNIEYFM